MTEERPEVRWGQLVWTVILLMWWHFGREGGSDETMQALRLFFAGGAFFTFINAAYEAATWEPRKCEK